MFLYRPGSSELVEDTFCNSWENINHRIESFLLWHISQVHNFKTIFQKVTIEEFIHQTELNDNVDEAQTLTEPISVDVPFMSLQKTRINLKPKQTTDHQVRK